MNPTLAGLSAILMWSLLALLTAGSGAVPPFQLLAMTFLIGGLSGVASWPFRQFRPERLRLPVSVWLLGVGGLFGYHFFYYTALRNAPVAEASLICYLWPMLIVLGSAFLPGERLRWFHLAGAGCGFAGAALLVSRGGGFTFDGSFAGYGSAFACAFIWAGYSILSRRVKEAPTDAVALFCLATSALALLCHLLLEQTVWPADFRQWTAVVLLGLFPVGLAFYGWDLGVKHGNIQLLGSAAYFAPLFSTAILIMAGLARPSSAIIVACLLITFGALLASGKMIPDGERRQ